MDETHPVQGNHYGGAPRRSWWRQGCLVFLLLLVGVPILLFFFGVFLVATVSALGPGTLFSDGSGLIVEEVVRPSRTTAKIAVIGVYGVLYSEQGSNRAGTRRICLELETAVKDPDVVAVLLDMDTPGGEVTASDEIHQAVRRCRGAGKPVVTCMRGVAASGGYFIAAGGDWIVANRLTLTGSIGVLIGATNYKGLFEKIGLQEEVYRSGPMKDMLSGSRERTDAERAYVQTLVDHAYREFAAVVAAGRPGLGSAEEVMRAEFGDGRILTGADAVRLGLVDQLGYFEDALAKAEALARVLETKVVRYRRPLRLSDFFTGVLGRAEIGLRSLLPPEAQALAPGRLYYMMPEALR